VAAANAAFNASHKISYYDVHLQSETLHLTDEYDVVITGHRGFLTKEALEDIAHTTLNNIFEFATTGMCRNQVRA
jgi:lactate dehydrogenase-like 2-hydroxyacid dehydrogenase